MPVIDVIDKKKYGRLLAQYLPGVIRSDDEHDRLAELLMKLALAEERTAEEVRLIEFLSHLSDDYEARPASRPAAPDELYAFRNRLRPDGRLRLWRRTADAITVT